MIKLVYDGVFDFMDGDNRQWTIKSDCIQADGSNYKGSSIIGRAGLIALGIVPAQYIRPEWARQCFRVIRPPRVFHFK